MATVGIVNPLKDLVFVWSYHSTNVNINFTGEKMYKQVYPSQEIQNFKFVAMDLKVGGGSLPEAIYQGRL